MTWDSVVPESVLFGGPVQDHFADRRVLVAGGMGFVGSNLTHALVRLGAEVTVVDSLQECYGGNPFNLEGIQDRVTVHQVAGRYSDHVPRARPDAVFFPQALFVRKPLAETSDAEIDDSLSVGLTDIIRTVRNLLAADAD